MKSPSSILSAATLIQVAAAVRWAEPSATPAGEWGVMGFSPIPTEAPGSEIGGIGIPKELRKRQGFPDNWCGYVNGDTNDVLSCGALYTCVHSGTAVGCCGSGPISLCTALYTSCANSKDSCGASCSANQKILKCSGVALPYCATYTFASSLVNYNCDSQSGVLSSVAFLSDVGFGTSVPSLTFATSRFSSPTDSSSSTSTRSSTTPTISSGTGFQFTTSPDPPSSRKKFGSGAIAGVVVGAIAIIGLIVGLVAFFLLRKKPTAAAAVAPVPPMQQQQPPPQQPTYQTPPVAGAYPQQQYPPQQGPYFAGAQPTAVTSYYDAKSQPTDVPPQYQPNTQSPQAPQQEYAAFNAAAAAGGPQPRDSMAKPAQPVPEISGTEVAGGPSRVTSPVSAVGTNHTGNQQGYEVGSTSGPVYEMPEGHR